MRNIFFQLGYDHRLFPRLDCLWRIYHSSPVRKSNSNIRLVFRVEFGLLDRGYLEEGVHGSTSSFVLCGYFLPLGFGK